MSTDATTSLEVIEHLDFEHAQPCEHHQHAMNHNPAEPARMLIRRRYDCCKSEGKDYFLCLSGWEHAGRRGIRCDKCSYHGAREEFWTILRFIGGAA